MMAQLDRAAEGQQPSSRTSIQQAIGMFLSKLQKQIPWGWHKGLMSTRGNLCSQPSIVQLDWHMPENTRNRQVCQWCPVHLMDKSRLITKHGTHIDVLRWNPQTIHCQTLCWCSVPRVPPDAWQCPASYGKCQFLDNKAIDATDWNSHSPYLSTIENLFNVTYRGIWSHKKAPHTVLELAYRYVTIHTNDLQYISYRNEFNASRINL